MWRPFSQIGHRLTLAAYFDCFDDTEVDLDDQHGFKGGY